MKKNQFNLKQLERIEKFYNTVNKIIPQINAPLPIIKVLSKILPDFCPFERTIYIGSTLVLYIPKLCHFNPLFNSILNYRISTYDDLS